VNNHRLISLTYVHVVVDLLDSILVAVLVLAMKCLYLLPRGSLFCAVYKDECIIFFLTVSVLAYEWLIPSTICNIMIVFQFGSMYFKFCTVALNVNNQ